jgi:hypothetical protein
MLVEEFYAFIYEEGPGMEGLITFQVRNPQGQSMMLPISGHSMEEISSYLPLVKGIVAQLGKKVKMVKFTSRTDIQNIEATKLEGLMDFHPPEGSNN